MDTALTVSQISCLMFSKMGELPSIACVIQARMASTRLPGKVLMDLAGAPLLQRLFERVSCSRLINRIVVATSDRPENDAIEALCVKMGCSVWRGSETNVLARMIDAAGDAEIMVRLTADNPFVDGLLVDFVVESFLKCWPAIRYAENIEKSGFPYGLFVEVADMEALNLAAGSADDMDREHVTWYLRRKPLEFPSVTVNAPIAFPTQSLTIDTIEDYQRLKPFYEDLFRWKPNFGFADIANNTSAKGTI